MNPDAGAAPEFALLASGAHFSRAVLQGLLRRNFRPRLLMLPSYPPAAQADIAGIEIDTDPAAPILRLATGIEAAYAPQTHQREAASLVRRYRIEFILVACWPYLIDSEFAESAAGAALNLHPSLLPKFRGPDPLQQQLAAGDERFGVSLHLLDRQFDHGDIVAQAELGAVVKIPGLKELELRCAEAGVLLFIDALSAWPNWNPSPQIA